MQKAALSNPFIYFKVICIIILAFIAYGFISKKRPAIQSIPAVELYYHLQFVTPNTGEIAEGSNNIGIFKNSPYIIYKVPYISIVSKIKMGKEMKVGDEKIVENKMKYNYIIYNERAKYGCQYDSLSVSHPKRILIDSFQRANTLKEFPFYMQGNILVTSFKKNKEPYLIQKETPKFKEDESYPDTCYYYYTNRFKNVGYSFSHLLDSTHRMKLYKVRYIYNASKKGKYPVDLPKREFYFELRNVKADTEIPKLVERFKSMEANLN